MAGSSTPKKCGRGPLGTGTAQFPFVFLPPDKRLAGW